MVTVPLLHRGAQAGVEQTVWRRRHEPSGAGGRGRHEGTGDVDDHTLGAALGEHRQRTVVAQRDQRAVGPNLAGGVVEVRRRRPLDTGRPHGEEAVAVGVVDGDRDSDRNRVGGHVAAVRGDDF
ncbi:MAG TPA: hypothetical protein PLV68_18430, partial [Ilumatobacteraceae bacterium]|nr:hypothetical protein [Ilumatobacteraceae bacterium]